jgi:hypothetical protein
VFDPLAELNLALLNLNFNHEAIMHFWQFSRLSFAKRMSIAAAAVVSAAFLAAPHAAIAQDQQQGSSSADYATLLSADLDSSAGPSPQYGQGSQQYPEYHGYRSHIAVEAGAGATAPIGNSQRDLTWGWNFTGGVGYKFAPRFALMAEYSFDRNKIPAAVLEAVGEPGGNVHTWSLTLDPVFYYKTGGRIGGYITGGGGFYRKLTSFTEPVDEEGEYCDYFYCYPYTVVENVVVSHYSSNQGGANLGTGLTFGRWNSGKFYAEARYTWLDTPGRGTQFVPVTFGYRW